MLLLIALLGLRIFFAWAPVLASLDNFGKDVIESDVSPGKNFHDFPSDRIPTREELFRALDSLSGIFETDKESIRRDILRRPQDSIQSEDDASLLDTTVFTSQFFVLFSLLSLITFIFVFFGYKLYKSLSERERKREEKKKNKQLKKRK